MVPLGAVELLAIICFCCIFPWDSWPPTSFTDRKVSLVPESIVVPAILPAVIKKVSNDMQLVFVQGL